MSNTFLRLKGEAIEAVRFDGSTSQLLRIRDWSEGAEYRDPEISTRDIRVFEARTPAGNVLVRPGYWVTRDENGDVGVLRDKQFRSRYPHLAA
jgi:hypothetical protein